MLQLQDYKITYPDGLTLTYADFHAPRDKLTALFGRSGCGKTSLLESLCSPSFPGRVSGCALLGGEPIPPPGPALYRRVSYCPQFSQAALNPKLTLQEHLRLVLRGNDIKPEKVKIETLLDQLRLERSLLSRRPGGLSGGQQQRMVLLLCTVKAPELLILDEPSSAIDLITLRDIADFLQKLKGKTTIIMVAHSRPLLERVANLIVEL